jgi:integrase
VQNWLDGVTPRSFAATGRDPDQQPRAAALRGLALISGRVSVKQVQTVLGHSSAVITRRMYAHVFPGDEGRTRNVLDAALSPLAD